MSRRFTDKLRNWLTGVRWSPGPDGALLDAAIVLFVGSVVAIACFSPWPWASSPWTALSAIATFLAAAVALWLGWREGAWRRQEQQERLDRADILLAMQTGTTGQALEKIVAMRDALSADAVAPDGYPDEITHIFQTVEILRQIDHLHLIQIDRRVGICLARCIANLNGVVTMLNLAEKDEAFRKMAFDCTVNAHLDLSAVIDFLYKWPGNPLQRQRN